LCSSHFPLRQVLFKEKAFKAALENFTAYDTSPRSLCRVVGLAFVNLSEAQPFPSWKLFEEAFRVSSLDSIKLRVLDLSVLELIFLVAMKRLEVCTSSSFIYDPFL